MAWKLAAHGPHTDPAAWRRGLIVGFVAALHLGLLLALLRPATPLLRRLARSAPAIDTIQVRLLTPPERTSPPPAPAVAAPHRRPTTTAPAHAPASARSAAAPPRPLDLHLPERMDAGGGQAPLYIPGGRGFGQSDRQDARWRARLPGMWGARVCAIRVFTVWPAPCTCSSMPWA